ncbi:MAG: ECF transporter S component [Armatimonadota bacterium]|nr:ECF transporter S component [Armatimonadota bacterium]MDR5697330.1 ECF transporter S component [Armatimonadota bacterium]
MNPYAPASPHMRRGLRFGAQDITMVGVLGAVAIALGFIPGLGFIPAPTPAGAATTMHIPAILAGILRGPLAGALVGAIFGFASFTRATLPFFKNPVIAFGPRILIGVMAYYAFVLLSRRTSRAAAAVILGATAYTILGPGAAAFEQAFAAGRVEANWLVNAYHAVASAMTAQSWVVPVLAGAVVGAGAFALLRGENAPPAAAAVVGTLTNTVGVLGLIMLFFGWPLGTAIFIGATHGLPEALLATVIVVPVYRAVKAAGLAGGR